MDTLFAPALRTAFLAAMLGAAVFSVARLVVTVVTSLRHPHEPPPSRPDVTAMAPGERGPAPAEDGLAPAGA